MLIDYLIIGTPTKICRIDIWVEFWISKTFNWDVHDNLSKKIDSCCATESRWYMGTIVPSLIITRLVRVRPGRLPISDCSPRDNHSRTVLLTTPLDVCDDLLNHDCEVTNQNPNKTKQYHSDFLGWKTHQILHWIERAQSENQSTIICDIPNGVHNVTPYFKHLHKTNANQVWHSNKETRRWNCYYLSLCADAECNALEMKAWRYRLNMEYRRIAKTQDLIEKRQNEPERKRNYSAKLSERKSNKQRKQHAKRRRIARDYAWAARKTR